MMYIIFACSLTAAAQASIDLSIGQINFSNPHPIEKENIIVNATVMNLGNKNANNVLVMFLDGSVPFGNTTISIPAFSNISVIKTWKAEIGPNAIKVAADPNNIIHENNENNNEASKNISINAYHTYFGNARLVTALGINLDPLFKKETAACNLLVADTDSNVDFSSLQAIGRRANGLPALNDFIDLDTVLNMTYFNDSITRVWTQFGNFPNNPLSKTIPKKTETFTVFGQTIPAVSVANSTNSTTFKTGILWDKSDNTQPSNQQFDIADKEDLIFITKINQSKVGKFGTYDYEIKVPALLRDYKPGSSTVDFYVDLDSSCLS